MKRKSFLFLSIPFAFFLLAGAFHHHPDGFKHEACSLCHLTSTHSEYSGTAGVSIAPPIPSPISLLAGEHSFRSPFISFFRFGRSPPQSSSLS
jgi:hypothetical protein